MSGGSWSYLYSKEVDELVQYGSIRLLEEMDDYLNSSGYEDVAKDVRRLVEYIKSARIRYEVDYDDYKFCPNCGQAIDWSDEHDA